MCIAAIFTSYSSTYPCHARYVCSKVVNWIVRIFSKPFKDRQDRVLLGLFLTMRPMPIANKVVDLVPVCEYVFSYIWQVSGWSVMCGKSVICPLCVESQWLVSYVRQVNGWSAMCGRSVVGQLCVESQWLVSYAWKVSGLSVMCEKVSGL